MWFHKMVRVFLTLPLADKSAVGAVNRPLQAIRSAFVG